MLQEFTPPPVAFPLVSTGASRLYEVVKFLLVSLFSLFIGLVYYLYKILLHFPLLYISPLFGRLSGLACSSGGAIWSAIRRAAATSGHALVAVVSFLAWQTVCFVETVITVTKALIWAAGVALVFPFVGGYRLGKIAVERLRGISARGIVDGVGGVVGYVGSGVGGIVGHVGSGVGRVGSGVCGVARRSSFLLVDGVKNLSSFLFFVLFSCCYFLLWRPLFTLALHSAWLLGSAWQKISSASTCIWSNLEGVGSKVSSGVTCVGSKLASPIRLLTGLKNVAVNGIYLLVG